MIAITLARKPLSGPLAKNALTYGTGGLNIDKCRIKHTNQQDLENHQKMVEAIRTRGGQRQGSWKNSSDLSGANPVSLAGRWPGNLILLPIGAQDIDLQADSSDVGGPSRYFLIVQPVED
jgi:hypothetical protein